jgi:hypothetical protein
MEGGLEEADEDSGTEGSENGGEGERAEMTERDWHVVESLQPKEVTTLCSCMMLLTSCQDVGWEMRW